ncbi:BFR1 [Sanghuangporus sanghuang]
MAAGAKAKTAGSANGAGPKSGAARKPKTSPIPSPSMSGAATPLSEDAPKGVFSKVTKPDKKEYDVEQEAFKAKIAGLQEKMSAIQNKINAGSSSGPGAERRAELRAELDKIKEEQGKFKNSRGQLMAQLKALNDGIAKKIKDLQAAKSKTQFKSVAEIDAHIRQLEKQVESGTMKLVDEKRALAEISTCKRLRKSVESFQAEQDSIERDRAQVEELRKQLDDPEAKDLSDRAEVIKEELGQIRKEGDEFYANRNKLFDERNEIKEQLDEIFNQKRESAQKYREENDRYWAKVHEDRARRAERAREQRQAEEEAKRKEVAQRLREDAAMPAYQSQIEDCQTLIDYFSGKTTGHIRLSMSEQPSSKGELAGVPKLEIRQVQADTAGLVARKKKSEKEDAYFVGGKAKKGGKKGKGGAKAAVNGSGDGDATPTASSGSLNVPLSTLTALLSLSIPSPASAADIPRVVSDLQTKKAWFEANQARVTQENIARAEAEIQRLLGTSGGSRKGVLESNAASSSSSSVKGVDTDTPPSGTGENPPEPTPTPADAPELEHAVSPEEVSAELEEQAVKNSIEITV